jgi:uncharacterized membrane protein (UPF0127 family)
MRGARVGSALLVAAVVAACGGGLEQRTAVIETAGGPVTVEVEIAETTEDRRRGLMHRETLPERAGMLFVYDEPHRGGFWMKNTLIPLSIAFLDADGRVLTILEMEPCRADPCPRYDPGVTYRSALEVNRGAFSRWGVDVGDVLNLEDS